MALIVKKRPAALKRPAAAEPTSRCATKRQSTGAACVAATWATNPNVTVASLQSRFAKSMGRDDCIGTGELVATTFGAEVSPVLGTAFPNMTYAAATVHKRSHVAPQLVSGKGANHVFILGRPTCVRHGKQCVLPGVDLLVADGPVKTNDLVTTPKHWHFGLAMSGAPSPPPVQPNPSCSRPFGCQSFGAGEHRWRAETKSRRVDSASWT